MDTLTEAAPRRASIERTTSETRISLELLLDGQGQRDISTGLPFFDHMLDLFAKHGFFDLQLQAKGDLEIDGHHTVEDVGICLGQALQKAIGNKAGIRRYGSFLLPMGEALSLVALDICGRSALTYNVELPSTLLGTFDSDLVVEFFDAFCFNAGVTLHIHMLAGKNAHHILEAIFKGFGRALDEATSIDPRLGGSLPSTKGLL